MPPVGFKPSAGKRPQNYALDRVATGTGDINHIMFYLFGRYKAIY